MIDASMSPPASSPFPVAGTGSGGSAPLSEEGAKPSLPNRQAGKFGSPELLVAPTPVQTCALFKYKPKWKPCVGELFSIAIVPELDI